MYGKGIEELMGNDERYFARSCCKLDLWPEYLERAVPFGSDLTSGAQMTGASRCLLRLL